MKLHWLTGFASYVTCFHLLGFPSIGFRGIPTMLSAFLVWKRGILVEACFVNMPWLSEQSCGERASLVTFCWVCNMPSPSEILLCANVCVFLRALDYLR